MSDGLVINVTYDSSVSDAPAGFTAAVNAVVQYYESIITNPITLNIDVGYGEIDGAPMSADDLGESDGLRETFSYAQVKAALAADATSAAQQTALASLPATGPNLTLTLAQATALGLLSGSTTFDGYIGIGSGVTFDYNTSGPVPANEYYFFGVAAHEISEVMGRISLLDTSNETSLLDLYRYTAPGERAVSGSESPAYFSIDGGVTDLANFNTNPSGDYGDWALSVPDDSYDAFSTAGTVNAVSAADLIVLNAIGYDLAPTAVGGDPTATAIVEAPPSGVLAAGATVTFSVTFSEAVTVSGAPALALNDGGSAVYTSGSGTSALVFTDTVAATDSDVSALGATAISLNGGSIADAGGNSVSLSLSGLSQAGPQIDTDASYVDQLYQTVLLRTPAAAETNFWVGELASGLTRSAVLADFVGSAEATTDVLPVVELYQALLTRAPDPGGLSAWVNAVRDGTPLATVTGDFLASAEFQNDHPGGLTPTAFVTLLYENVLGRAPDSAGEQFWLNTLAAGNNSTATEAAVVVDFITSPEAIADATAPIESWLSTAATTDAYPSAIPGINGAAGAGAVNLVGVAASHAVATPA